MTDTNNSATLKYLLSWAADIFLAEKRGMKPLRSQLDHFLNHPIVQDIIAIKVDLRHMGGSGGRAELKPATGPVVPVEQMWPDCKVNEDGTITMKDGSTYKIFVTGPSKKEDKPLVQTSEGFIGECIVHQYENDGKYTQIPSGSGGGSHSETRTHASPGGGAGAGDVQATSGRGIGAGGSNIYVGDPPGSNGGGGTGTPSTPPTIGDVAKKVFECAQNEAGFYGYEAMVIVYDKTQRYQWFCADNLLVSTAVGYLYRCIMRIEQKLAEKSGPAVTLKDVK